MRSTEELEKQKQQRVLEENTQSGRNERRVRSEYVNDNSNNVHVANNGELSWMRWR